jgi:hypothetical protein
VGYCDWRHLSELDIQVGENTLEDCLFNMQDFQVIHMPQDGALLAIDGPVHDTPVVFVTNETLSFEVCHALPPEQQCCLERPI